MVPLPIQLPGQKSWFVINFSISIIPQIQSVTKYCPFPYQNTFPIKSFCPFPLLLPRLDHHHWSLELLLLVPNLHFLPIHFPYCAPNEIQIKQVFPMLKTLLRCSLSSNLIWLTRPSWPSFCLFPQPSSLTFTLCAPAWPELFHSSAGPCSSCL